MYGNRFRTSYKFIINYLHVIQHGILMKYMGISGAICVDNPLTVIYLFILLKIIHIMVYIEQ